MDGWMLDCWTTPCACSFLLGSSEVNLEQCSTVSAGGEQTGSNENTKLKSTVSRRRTAACVDKTTDEQQERLSRFSSFFGCWLSTRIVLSLSWTSTAVIVKHTLK